MVVKITMGGIPLKSEIGLLFELPEGMEWGQVKRTALQQMLMIRIMEGAVPDDSKVDILFPIKIRMPCCNKVKTIKSYDDFPDKTIPCCDYGSFVLIRTVAMPKRKQPPLQVKDASPPGKPDELGHSVPVSNPETMGADTKDKPDEQDSFGTLMGKSIAEGLSKCPKCGGKMEGKAVNGAVMAVCSACGFKLKV